MASKAKLPNRLHHNAYVSRDLEATRARLSSSETQASELIALRDERDVIRTRVSEMLQQLEAI